MRFHARSQSARRSSGAPASPMSRRKSARADRCCFVTVDHELRDSMGSLCISERQDIAYAATRRAPRRLPSAPPATEMSDACREIRPDPALLFRYSALTFNAHRIHYDRDYAREVEDYLRWWYQGPLTATLLVDRFLRETPGATIAAFEFRARRPFVRYRSLRASSAAHRRRRRSVGGRAGWTKTMSASIRTGTEKEEACVTS